MKVTTIFLFKHFTFICSSCAQFFSQFNYLICIRGNNDIQSNFPMSFSFQFVIITHKIPPSFHGGQWFLANLKFKSVGLGMKVGRVQRPEHHTWQTWSHSFTWSHVCSVQCSISYLSSLIPERWGPTTRQIFARVPKC